MTVVQKYSARTINVCLAGGVLVSLLPQHFPAFQTISPILVGCFGIVALGAFLLTQKAAVRGSSMGEVQGAPRDQSQELPLDQIKDPTPVDVVVFGDDVVIQPRKLTSSVAPLWIFEPGVSHQHVGKYKTAVLTEHRRRVSANIQDNLGTVFLQFRDVDGLYLVQGNHKTTPKVPRSLVPGPLLTSRSYH